MTDKAWLIQLLTNLIVVSFMLGVGMNVSALAVIQAIRRTSLLLRSLLLNIVLVPILVVGIAILFGVAPEFTLAMIISAAAPGAPLGPPLSMMARGDVPFATGLMVVLAGLSVVTTPLICRATMMTIAGDVELDFAVLAAMQILLTSMLIPLGGGFLVQALLPRVSQRLAKPLRLIANTLLLATIILIVVDQLHILTALGWQVLLAMLLGVALPLLLGYWMGGPEGATRRTLAVTTGVRNTALALLIAATSFAGTVVVPAVFAYGLFMVVGGLAYATFAARRSAALQTADTP
ncbi:MAG: bile acid:sodium symporter [Proteobacteria bacterium]|nr:bile acid:sodium symporter [Pseudomonadota bacterium]